MSKYSAVEIWNRLFGDREEVLDYTGRLMKKSACGNPQSRFHPTLDHIRPLSKGGADILENIVVCHRDTNKEKANEDDPLAGLSGVSAAPVPSSLVDEEFTDLTSKLFGEDFADINETPVDEDGWDFDFDSPAAEPEVSEPVQEIKKTEPVVPAPLNISSTDFKKVEKGEPKPADSAKIEEKPK